MWGVGQHGRKDGRKTHEEVLKETETIEEMRIEIHTRD